MVNKWGSEVSSLGRGIFLKNNKRNALSYKQPILDVQMH